jgi:hypothetical protein
VAAIFLVGAGGLQYWIEPGPNPHQIAFSPIDADKLTQLYPCLSVKYDSDLFNSVLVSMGSMGVIYALLLRVVPQYSLLQWNQDSSWESVKARARTDLNGVLHGNFSGMVEFVGRWIPSEEYAHPSQVRGRYFGLTINPVKNDDGTHYCIITNRFELRLQPEAMGVSPGNIGNISTDALQKEIQKNPLFAQAVAHGVAQFVIVGVVLGLWPGDFGAAKGYPSGILGTIYQAEDDGRAWAVRDAIRYLLQLQFPVVPTHEWTGAWGHQSWTPINFSWEEEPEVGSTKEREEDRYPQIDLGYKIMASGGSGGGLTGFVSSGVQILSVEAFNSLEACFNLIDSILAHCDDLVDQNKYPVGYIALRTCKPTSAFLGPEQAHFGSVVGAVEIGMMKTRNTLPLLIWLQNEALANGCTLHWGQSCSMMNGSIVESTQTYPKVATWKKTQQSLGRKTFLNQFMRRFGLG